MAGSIEGGRKAAATNRIRHGADFYARIGARGGAKGHTGGFAADNVRARAAGVKGGTISNRSKRKLSQKELAERRELGQKRFLMRLAELEAEVNDDQE